MERVGVTEDTVLEQNAAAVDDPVGAELRGYVIGAGRRELSDARDLRPPEPALRAELQASEEHLHHGI